MIRLTSFVDGLTNVLTSDPVYLLYTRNVSKIVHEPDNVLITSRGTKSHDVLQNANYPHTTYLYDSNQDRVASILNFKMPATILNQTNLTPLSMSGKVKQISKIVGYKVAVWLFCV